MESGESEQEQTTKETDKREGGHDNNDNSIVGSNDFVCRLKQQSINERGTRGKMVMMASGNNYLFSRRRGAR